ncbi:hypothetical protein HMPREF1609_00676, partial [Escherichia coli 908541]
NRIFYIAFAHRGSNIFWHIRASQKGEQNGDNNDQQCQGTNDGAVRNIFH